MPHRIWLALLILAALRMPLAPVRVAADATSAAGRSAFGPPLAPTGGIVGNGTSASCTESALDAKLAGGGVVTFACGGPWTITLTSAKTISADTTINGGDVITLSGGDTARLFSVNIGVTLRLQHLVLDGAVHVGSDGGAIANHGNLWLENSTIQNSFTGDSDSGGAIFSDGPVTITNSLLQNNQGGNGGGALFATSSQALVTISNSTFRGNRAIKPTAGAGGAIWVAQQAQVFIMGGAILSNSAQFGGGLYLSLNATVTLTSAGAPALVSGNSAVSDGGGIYSSGALSVTNSTLSGNSAFSSDIHVTTFGGGIRNAGTLIVINSTFSGNSAQYGGGIYSSGTLTVTNSTLSANTSGEGGGLNNAGRATLTNATLSGNSAPSGQGGGIYNFGTLAVTNSTLSGNSALAGGGIRNDGALAVTNSTLSGNSANSGNGGGLDNYGPATLTNATLSGNTATHGGGMHQYTTPYLTYTISLSNTLIAGGLLGANCDADTNAFFVSSGYNLSSDATCAPYFIQPSDLNSTSPNLGPLANNGGPTLTHRPHALSPAIDAIPLSVNGCGTTLISDQRGAPRPIGGGCDIGAVETGLFWLPLIRR